MERKKDKERMKEIDKELKDNHLLLEEIKEMLNILIEAEKRKREEDMKNLKNTNEYDQLMLNNLSSRISILEEEAENYQRNKCGKWDGPFFPKK